MALPRVPIRSLTAGEQTLRPEAEKHLVRVLRLGEGGRFLAFDPDLGMEAQGKILSIKKGHVQVVLDDLRAAPMDRRILWVHGLTKGDKNDAIVRDATELGATDIVIVPCARSIPPFKTAEQKVSRWQRIADEASRQCGRVRAPNVRIERTWDDGLLFASVNAQPGDCYCMWENATDPLGPLLARSKQFLAFAAGPEGGLTEEEVDQARAHGFKIVSIGDRILRTETVPAAVLGAVMIIATE